MYVVLNKVDHEKFESNEKAGNGSSFAYHFDAKTAENG